MYSKKNDLYVFFLGFLVLLFSALLKASDIESVTQLSGIEELSHLKKYYAVKGFKLGGSYKIGAADSYEFGGVGGVSLESLGEEPLRLSYIAVGKPEHDKSGKINNAVVVNSYYSGDSSLMYYHWYSKQAGNNLSEGAVIGPGEIIDTNNNYVIFLDALGLWGASKPSDGLGPDFPEYNVYDYVQANYRLLRDKLNIAKIRLATGISMGAIQSYVWAVLHPEYVDAIMPIGGGYATKTDPVVRSLFQLMTAAMMSDPVWVDTKGKYYHLPKSKHPNQGMEFGWSILALTGFSFDYQIKLGWEGIKGNVFSWDKREEMGRDLLSKSKNYDVNDLLHRNKTIFTFDIEQYIERIKAKTLILHVENDQWFRVINARKAAKLIKGSSIYTFESPLSHYGIIRAPNKLKDKVLPFLETVNVR